MSIPWLDVLAPDFLRDQDNLLNVARDRHPFAMSDRGVEILAYRECQTLLRDRRAQKDHLAVVEQIGITDPMVLDYKRRVLVGQGLTETRDRMRGVLGRAISSRQMELLRAETRAMINRILDNVDTDSSIDFIDEVATLIPSTFFCQWAGLPVEDARLVSGLSDVMLKIFWLDPSYTEQIQNAYRELFAYMEDHLDLDRVDEGRGFVSHLRQEQKQGNVQPHEIADWVVFALEGSTDNTVHQIGLALGRLLETPELWDKVRQEPDLVPAVVGESMRLDARTRVIHRLAAEDIDVPGGTIRAGTNMFFWVRAAHLDPRTFHEPEKFDIRRPRHPGPLLFGKGAYSCIGQWMARLEVQETLSVIIERFPGIRLAGAPERSIDMFSLSANRLPVVLNGATG
jgi:cytochrome P450